jgi:hypothetical protein
VALAASVQGVVPTPFGAIDFRAAAPK